MVTLLCRQSGTAESASHGGGQHATRVVRSLSSTEGIHQPQQQQQLQAAA